MIPPSFRDDTSGATKSEMFYSPVVVGARAGSAADNTRKLQSPESKRTVTQWMKTSDSVSGKMQPSKIKFRT